MAVVHDLVVAPQARPLSGSVPVLSDPRIAELALLCAALAEGESEIRWLSAGRDIETMMAALRSLGVTIEGDARKARVRGVGLSGLVPARDAIDCGSSMSVMASLAGVLVSRPFETVLSGDPSLLATDLAGLSAALRRAVARSKVDSRRSMQVGSRRRWWWARCLLRSCSRRSIAISPGPSLTSSPP